MLIREWRNAQIDILRQDKLLSVEDQQNYFDNTIFPSMAVEHPKQILFSFLHNGRCIGYGALVHISLPDKRGELSFLVDPERAANPEVYRADFQHFIELMKSVVFGDLQFQRIHVETWDIRPLHIAILEERGFRREGRLRRHCLIHGKPVDAIMHGFTRDDWEAAPTYSIIKEDRANVEK